MMLWLQYLIIGLIVGIVVSILFTLLRTMFGSKQRAGMDEVAATVAPPLSVTAEETTQNVELFLLSRYDIIDYVEEMSNNTERFILTPNVKERETENLPDYIRCGEVCFAVVFERNDCVHNIAVRLDSTMAQLLGELHPVEHASYLTGNDWYNLSIDQSYKSKREVYKILNDSYDYVFRMYRALSDEEARAEFMLIEHGFASSTAEIEKVAAAAESNYLIALNKFKSEHYTDFRITRKEIVVDTRALENSNITVKEREDEPQMPVSLKYKGKTYAMLYGTDKGVMMVVKLSDTYVDKIATKHPEIRRAKFPIGTNWYYVPIDGAFESKEAVYTMLNMSYAYVLAKYGSEADIESAPKLIYTDFSDSEDKDNTDLDAGITRKAIIEYTISLENPDITVIDRPMEPQLPVSLKYKGKTYAMLYGTESGVVMIGKISDDYVKMLKKANIYVTKAKFPAGANWYLIPFNKTFANIEEVYSTLNDSVKFIESYKNVKKIID